MRLDSDIKRDVEDELRCQFQLLRADEGMKGGGQGQCQLPSGRTIDAEFPPS